jgi:hypothetical protein
MDPVVFLIVGALLIYLAADDRAEDAWKALTRKK